MRRVRSRLTILLLILVIVTSLFSLTIGALVRNGIIFQRDNMRYLLFGYAAKDVLLLLIAVVGVYADFQVNGKATIITIVAVIAVLGAFVLPELTARRFIKKDKSFIGHTMRYVFNDNGINVLDEQNGTTALHAWGNIMNMYETAGYFFMFLGKQSALLIPKRCLSDEDLADFREMLQFQLGSRYENRTQKSKKAK